MAIMTACLSYLSAKYHNDINIQSNDYRYKSTINLISSVPVISAWILNYILNVEFQKQDQQLSIAENFINMAFPDISKSQKDIVFQDFRDTLSYVRRQPQRLAPVIALHRSSP